MGFWLLVLAGATVGWVFGGGVGSSLGAVIGVVMALVGHLLQQRAFLFGIHNADRLGNVGRVRDLLRKNPSLVNARDASGNTPLHCAIGYFELGVVEELLAHKADVNARDNNGVTPLHIVAAGVPPNPPHPPKSVQLTAAGLQGIHLKIAELLLAQTADLHARTAWGWTPLETAERANTNYMVELLRQQDT
jgi:ankyrin repeat protein